MRARPVTFVALVLALVALAAALPLAAAAAGEGWSPQSSGTSQNLRGVCFSDVDHGWAVGDNGTIVATDNCGITWNAQASGTTAQLNAVSFRDAVHGWAVGAGGTILATADGGAHWSARSSGSTEMLRGVSFSNVTRGWAVGDTGTILATADGGTHWNAQSSGTTGDLYAVRFPDAARGWAVGSPGYRAANIIFSMDSGARWLPRLSGDQGDLYGVSFPDTIHGWAVGYRGAILATSGGAIWTHQLSRTMSPLFAVSFPDATHGWAVGYGGTVLGTADGGSQWSRQGSGTSESLLAVSFPDAIHGWAVGNRGTIIATISGGRPPETCTVTPSVVGGHGTITPATPEEYEGGATPTFTFRPDPGYRIEAVRVDGARVGLTTPNSYTFPPLSADHTISVEYAPSSLTIVSSAGLHGSISPSGPVSLPWGGAQSYVIRADSGYHVADVRVDGRSVGPVSVYAFTNVTAGHTISASFAANLCAVSALVGTSGHGTVTPAGTKSYVSGSTPTYLFTPERGYYASRLTVDGVAVAFTAPNRYTFAPLSGDHVLQVFFTVAPR